MSKAKQKAGAASSDTIQDISHEEVKHENGISIIPKIVSPEDQIKLEIAKFNIAESGINQLKEIYSGIVIRGPEDKAGYKVVRDAWSEVRSTRTKLEKKGLELRNGYGVITKAIKKEEDRLVELISPLEDELYGKWKAIDEEKDRVERERREAEEREAMARVEEVLGLGMVFRDGFYVVGESMSMDVATLRSQTLEQYEKLKAAIEATVKFQAEAAAVAAEFEKRKAEEMQREKEELIRQQAEMRKAQEDLQRQKEELAQAQREAAKQKIQNRIGKLVSLGMKERDFDVHYNNGFSQGLSIQHTDFYELNDKDFEAVLATMEDEIKKLNIAKADHEEKVNQEKEAKAKKEKLIADFMQRAGMIYNYNSKEFQFTGEEIKLVTTFEKLMPLSEPEIVIFANDLTDKISRYKAEEIQAQKDREEAAAKEENAAKSDKQRFDELILELESLRLKLHPDKFKSGSYKKQAGYVNKALIELVNANKK